MTFRSGLLPVILGLACIPVGAWLHRGMAPAQDTGPSASAPTREKRLPSSGITGYGAESLAAWNERVRSASAAELPGLAARLAVDAHRGDRAMWAALLARWSEADAPAMIAFLNDHAPPELKSQLLADGWFAWGCSHLEQAIATAAERKLPPVLTMQILNGVLESDPHRAVQYALSLPDAQSRLATLAARIAEKAPEEIPGLLARAVYDGPRLELQKAQIGALAVSDPEAALKFARSCGSILHNQVSDAIAAIARHDPQQAAASLATMPADRTRALSSVDLAGVWMEKDPHAALAWIRQLDDGPVRQSSLLQAAASPELSPQDGLALMEEAGWKSRGDFFNVRGGMLTYAAEEGPDPVGTGGRLLARWAATDPGAARSYLQTTIPEKLRPRIAEASAISLP